MTFELWLAFVIASVILVTIPGPTTLTIVSYSLTHGARARIPLVAATTLGDISLLALSMIGLGTLLATSAFWFSVVKWIGGLYLLYLGLSLFFNKASLAANKIQSSKGSFRKLFANAFVVTALNPKGIIFFVAFLPQFMNPEANTLQQLWILAVTFIMISMVNSTLYAVFASSASKRLSSSKMQKRFNRLGGSLLASAGIWVLLAKRPV